MPTLAINTSANFVSIALLDQTNLLAELDSRRDYQHRVEAGSGLPAGAEDHLPPGYTQKRSKRGNRTQRVFPPGASVMLAPMIRQLMETTGVALRDVDLLCVDHGPGMFTGLRVAVVTVKSLAYAIGADLVAVNTLEAIAAQTLEHVRQNRPGAEPNTCHVVTNAQRQQLFVGSYRWVDTWQVQSLDLGGKSESTAARQSNQILGREDWLSQRSPRDLVTGTGLKPLAISLEEKSLEVAPSEVWELRAASVGQVGWQHYQKGQRDDFWKLEPFYFRPSAAEEVRRRLQE